MAFLLEMTSVRLIPDPNGPLITKLNEGISDDNRKVFVFESDWLENDHTQAEMSIDQCYWMYMAMKIVMKCVPPTMALVGPYGAGGAIVAVPFTPWNGQVNYSFVAEARFITRRITENPNPATDNITIEFNDLVMAGLQNFPKFQWGF